MKTVYADPDLCLCNVIDMHLTSRTTMDVLLLATVDAATSLPSNLSWELSLPSRDNGSPLILVKAWSTMTPMAIP
jgi:hypothetical protein